jgi:dTDP-glucose 4,6-dehydratase
MKHVLVTGGAGFIGSNFIHYLANHYGPDITIHNIDALTYAGNLANLDNLANTNYHFHHACITDRATLTGIFAHPIDCVVHFAAESHVDRSIHDSSPFITTNVLGTQCLLDVAMAHSVKQFIHISTDEVYGSTQTGYFTETSPLNPSSPYAASKTSSDLVALAYYKTFGFPVRVTRCSNNYGPFQFPEKLIPLMIQRALANQSLPVYGDGSNVRDWLHVTDHCRAIHSVMTAGKDGEVYNIGGHGERDNLPIVKTILSALNKPESLINFVTDRLGHDWRYAIDFTKIQRDCDWAPSIDFESGIQQTIAWYQNSPSWLKTTGDQA